MSEQPLNLRRSVRILHRHKVLVSGVIALGVALGVGYAELHPPTMSSEALVVMSAPKLNIATDALIAKSQPVLYDAAQRLGGAVASRDLAHAETVTTVTPIVLSIGARNQNAALAEHEANALADSYIAFIQSSQSPVGSVSAHLLAPASPATGTSPVDSLVTNGIIGAIAGALAGFVLALRVGRGDRRLRERDEIAGSIGVPVLAGVHVTVPSDAARWARLFDDYKPSAVEAWRLRSTLERLQITSPDAGSGEGRSGVALTVLSASSDRKAFALGPQLAVFAASMGIPTMLMIAPQEAAATAALRAACSSERFARPELQAGRLRVAVGNGVDADGRPVHAGLTVVVAAFDAGAPLGSGAVGTPLTILGVSAGRVSAEQLARAAAAAADSGSSVFGILVADPDPADLTTGLVQRQVSQMRAGLPVKQVGWREASDGARSVAVGRAGRRGR
jgi:capsular polysaccharide biosynthesis protein